MRQEESPYGLQELLWSLRGDSRRDPVSQPLLSVSPNRRAGAQVQAQGALQGLVPDLVQTGSGPRSHKTHGDSRFPDQVLPPAHRENSMESKTLFRVQEETEA